MALEDVGVNLVVKGAAAFNSAMQAAGKAVIGVTAAVVGASVGIGKLVMDSASLADKYATLSGVTGISTTALQEFDFIGKKLDVDLETITGSMSRMVRSMGSAQDGSKNIADAYKQLGVKIVDNNGKLRDSKVVYGEVLTALGKMTNETEQDALAMQIFGRSAMELNPLIRAGKDRLNELTQAAHDTGAVMSAETVEGLDQFKDTMDSLGNSLKGNIGTMSGVFLPLLKKIGAAGTKGMEKLHSVVSRLAPLMQTMFEAGNVRGGLLTMLTTLFGPKTLGPANKFMDVMGKVVQFTKDLKASLSSGEFTLQEAVGNALMKAGPEGGLISNMGEALFGGPGGIVTAMSMLAVKIITSLIAGLVSNQAKILTFGLNLINGIATALIAAIPNLLPIIVTLLNSIVQFITQTLPLLIPLGLQVIMTLVTAILGQLPAIVTTAVQLLVTLAQGIADAIPNLIPAVVAIIPQIVTTLIENLPALITAALQIIMALANGLIQSLPTLIAAIPQIVTTLVEQLIILAPQLLISAVELIAKLIEGIVSMLPKIGEAAGNIIETLVGGIAKLATRLWETGKSIVEGIWNGISNAADTFRRNIEGFFSGIVDGVKRLLGITSPSKVFGEIGLDMGLGVGYGFQKSMKRVSAGINKTVRGITAQASFAMASMPGMAGGMVSAGPTTNNYSTSYNLSVMTNQSPQVVQQSFSIMRMLAG